MEPPEGEREAQTSRLGARGCQPPNLGSTACRWFVQPPQASRRACVSTCAQTLVPLHVPTVRMAARGGGGLQPQSAGMTDARGLTPLPILANTQKFPTASHGELGRLSGEVTSPGEWSALPGPGRSKAQRARGYKPSRDTRHSHRLQPHRTHPARELLPPAVTAPAVRPQCPHPLRPTGVTPLHQTAGRVDAGAVETAPQLSGGWDLPAAAEEPRCPAGEPESQPDSPARRGLRRQSEMGRK